MYDPRARLYRPIPGEPLHAPMDAVERAMEWDKDRCERSVEIAAYKEPREFKVRRTSVTREPGPYTPKLIRLVRNPYQQEKGWFVRNAVGDRARPEVRTRQSFTEATMRTVQRREPFPKPTDARMRLSERPRPSAAAFLGEGDAS